MNIIEIDKRLFKLPSDKITRDFIRQILNQYNIDTTIWRKKIINRLINYTSISVYSYYFEHEITSIENLNNIRLDALKLILGHIMKEAYNATKCLYEDDVYYINVLLQNLFINMIYNDDVEHLFIPYIQKSSYFYKLYFITDKNDILYFNDDDDCALTRVFINYAKKCNTLDEAIVECNYYNNYDKIKVLYDW